MEGLFIGLISGTSVDSIDSALVNIYEEGFELLESGTSPIKKDLKQRIFEAVNASKISNVAINDLDIELGKAFGVAALHLLEKASLDSADISAIGSHGQTIKHAPNEINPYSLQIGSPKEITRITNIRTVANFRKADILAGGQGAPLAPLFHKFIFQSNNLEKGVVINIGGISNITLIDNKRNEVFGYDCGPGNCLMDAWARCHGRGDYDKDGAWASSGKFNSGLLNLMIKDPFFSVTYPKSTGTDYFNLSWLNEKVGKLTFFPSAEDVQATLSELTAQIIYLELKRLKALKDQIYICGGGIHNNFLTEKIQLKIRSQTFTTTSLGLDPDYLEACCFAWLAQQRLNNVEFDLSKITGSKKPIYLGTIFDILI
uniref:Anhydro-N-acetylmuramic acid kinase n=1 Tax=uncultured gamma proteobacterium HF4000_19M20 TaxID=710987 RepID=E0XVT1_9GAMM|nr:predicted molecular chaperone distantly related to hsp70-fold metalloproteases [uncultured gamma proteobacterium HF4000_19M20]